MNIRSILSEGILGALLLFSLLLQAPTILLGLSWGVLLLLVGKICKFERVFKCGYNTLITYDQVANTATGGDPSETISSRTGKLKDSRLWASMLSKFLDIFQKNHTTLSIEKDRGKDKIVE